MIVRIASSRHARLIALAASAPGREVCGLLLGARGRGGAGAIDIDEVVPAANVAADAAAAFELDPAALFAALRAERAGGPRLLGHYHSHPHGPAAPSARDAALALDAGRLWLIVGRGAVTAWRAAPGGSVAGAFEPVTLLVIPDGCETGHTSPQGRESSPSHAKDRG